MTPPDFIPEDIQAAHVDEARWLIRRHTPEPSAPSDRPPRTAPSDQPLPSGPSDESTDPDPETGRRRSIPSRFRAASRLQRWNVAVAGLMALPGSLFLTGLWAWLAITTGASVWWFIAGGGAAMSVVLAVAIAAFGLALSIRDDPAVERSTPDSPAELVGVDPSAQGPAPNLR